MRARARLGMALLGTSLVAGCDGPTSAGVTRGRLTLQLPFGEGAAAQQQGRRVLSIISRVRVIVGSAGGTRRDTLTQTISRTQAVYEFNVVVPGGTTTFQAQVLSNTDVVVFDGQAPPTSVEQDGFAVDVSLAAVAPVLALAADTIRTSFLTSVSFADTLSVLNRGAGTLVWRVEPAPVSTALAGCGGRPCVRVEPAVATLTSGRLIQVSRIDQSPPAQPLVLRLASAQGYVDLAVVLR